MLTQLIILSDMPQDDDSFDAYLQQNHYNSEYSTDKNVNPILLKKPHLLIPMVDFLALLHS